MRLVMLCGTGLWIANNLIAGSVGGSALEIVIAVRQHPDDLADGARRRGKAGRPQAIDAA